MIFLDCPGIPLPIIRALQSDAYRESLDSHFEQLPPHIQGKFHHAISVTTVPRSPRQRLLFARHSSEIVVDPLGKTHAMLGRVVHSILEENKEEGQIVEERLGIIFPLVLPDGKRLDIYLHGAADIYDPAKEELDDYKTPKTASLLYDKSDHHAQLNVLGYIWRKNGKKVSKLNNIYLLLKDWDPHKISDTNDYPKLPVVVSPVPLWTDDECLTYLNGRLLAHFSNESKSDDDLDYCTDQERWQSTPLFKVLKLEEDGTPQKIAKATCGSCIEADDAISVLLEEELQKLKEKNNKLKKPKPEETLITPSYIIKEIPSTPRRCDHCDVFAWCNQRKAELSVPSNTPTNEHE